MRNSSFTILQYDQHIMISTIVSFPDKRLNKHIAAGIVAVFPEVFHSLPNILEISSTKCIT